MKLRILACLSVLSMVGIAAAPAASAAPAPSRYVVTISTPAATMSLGTSVKVTGTVRGAGATTVTLYQLSGRRWVPWVAARLVAGRYTVYYKPVTSGAQTIRVITPTTRSHLAGSSPNRTIAVYAWHYLSDFADTPRLVANSSWGSPAGIANINGRVYLHSPSDYHLSVGDVGYLDYNLSRACLTLRTTGGLTDESPTGTSAELEVQTDGVPRWAKTMTVGQAQVVSLSVQGNLRLRLQDTVVAAVSGDYTKSAFGDAQVLCRF